MRKIYEHTKNELLMPSLAEPALEAREKEKNQDIISLPPAEHNRRITRQNLVFNGSAYILRNFLTPSECQHFIEQAESLGFEDSGYSHRIRQTDRVSAFSTDVAEMMFNRWKSFLTSETVHSQDDEEAVSFDLKVSTLPEGLPRTIEREKWTAYGLNPCFRLCRYESSGFFFPHHDGGFYIDSSNQSLQTFMVYLNDDFEGGETNFYNELQEHYRKPRPDNLVCSYTPEAGDVIIFNSQITHDGGKVKKGRKYVLRSEIMFSTAKTKQKEEKDQKTELIKPDHDDDVEFTWP